MPWSPWLKRWFRKLWCGEGAKGKGKGARAKGQRSDGKPCRLCQSVHEKTRALHTAKLHGRGMSAKRNTGAKNMINKIASDTMHLVEERMNYASSVGLDAAFLHSYDLTHDAVRIFARDHNISEAALSLSAVIARLLYPFFFITPANACDRVAFWREFVRRGDIPEPMMAFLKTRFSSTNWHCVLFSEGTVQAVGEVDDRYHAKKKGIPRRSLLPPTEAAEKGSGSSDAGAEHRDEDPYSTVAEGAHCHYIHSHHNGVVVPPCFAIRMKSKNASPRWRRVCVDCAHRLEADSLVDLIRELRVVRGDRHHTTAVEPPSRRPHG